MKSNTQRPKWYLFVAIVLAFTVFSFPLESSAMTDNAGSESEILTGPTSQVAIRDRNPYSPAYPRTNGKSVYDEYIRLATQDVPILFENDDYIIPGGLKKWEEDGNTIIYNERCDPIAEAFGMLTFDSLSREEEIFRQVPISGTLGGFFRGIAEAAVMRCQFQDAIVDSAEIEAGYENTRIIISQLNDANRELGNLNTTISSRASQKSVNDLQVTIDKLSTTNLDATISSRASQKSVDDLQVTLDKLSTANLDATISSRASQDSLDELSLAVGNYLPENAVSAGVATTCSLTAKGGVVCWGFGNTGQLGNGLNLGSTTPVQVKGLSSGVAAISVGDNTICALMISGSLKCWGSNTFGQFGNGKTGSGSNIPVNAGSFTSGVAAISSGGYHICALMTSGGVECWGNNFFGQLGDGSNLHRSTPVQVEGLSSGVAAISASYDHTCALMASGGVKCWGQNWDGRFNTDNKTPVDVEGLTSGVASISIASNHSCVLMTSGGVKCWGNNTLGQLGNGSNTNNYTPVDVEGLTSGVASVSTASNHSCALMNSGGVKCWGSNNQGQLGNGSNTNSNVPVDVTGLNGVVEAIFTGTNYTCAQMNSGYVKCWGGNIYGQLGNGTTNFITNFPTSVNFPRISLADMVGASQSSLNNLQASVDALDEKVSNRASQASLTSLHNKVDTNLDVKVSTLAAKEDLSALATQDSLDTLINFINDNLDAVISSRASQESLDALQTAIDSLDAAFVLVLGKLTSDLDVAVSTRASQESLDALQSAVDATNAAITIVQEKLNSDLDVAVSTRASQADLDELRGVVDQIASELSKLDVAVSTRASQESLDELHVQVDALNETSDQIESKVDALTNKADTLETKVETIQSTLDQCEVEIAIVNGPGGRNYTFYVHTTWHGERQSPSKLTVWVGGNQQQPSSTSVISGVTSVVLRRVNWNDLRNQPLTVEAALSGGTCSAVEIIQ